MYLVRKDCVNLPVGSMVPVERSQISGPSKLSFAVVYKGRIFDSAYVELYGRRTRLLCRAPSPEHVFVVTSDLATSALLGQYSGVPGLYQPFPMTFNSVLRRFANSAPEGSSGFVAVYVDPANITSRIVLGGTEIGGVYCVDDPGE
jgi:hypothetical protein